MPCMPCAADRHHFNITAADYTPSTIFPEPPLDTRCTVFVSTTDKYSDLWDNFFDLFKKHWDCCPYPIVMASDQKEFHRPGWDIKNPRFHSRNPRYVFKWGELTLRALETIKTPYVLFLLEDFFFTRKVDCQKIKQCLDWMDADPDIGKFQLRPSRYEERPISEYPPFVQSFDGMWRINAQATIWRKDLLVRTIEPHMNIWFWERVASDRANKGVWPQKLYQMNYENQDDSPIFYPEGGVLHFGKWTLPGLLLLARNDLATSGNRTMYPGFELVRA